jgi:hypothetical protein
MFCDYIYAFAPFFIAALDMILSVDWQFLLFSPSLEEWLSQHAHWPSHELNKDSYTNW